MQNLNLLEQAKYHAWFQHGDADGWVTVAQKIEGGRFKQHHYKPQDLAEKLSEWLGEDVYFSQNTFYKPNRRIENIRQLRALYVDLDFYLFNYAPEWIIGKLEHDFYGKSIPEPNLVIFSGQGIVLIWLLDPLPYKALPLWQVIQNYLLKELSELGGDAKAVDAARVFRIAGSSSSKNGMTVRAEYRHRHRYDLRQIQTDYLPDLDEVLQPAHKPKRGRKKAVVQLFTTYRLHYARLRDLVRLVELRGYDVKGHRETICFLYRYWLCCYTNDPQEALRQAQELNSQFRVPLPLREVERATRSAEIAWAARNDEAANAKAQALGYPGAGYNLRNSKIISWLEITSAEMEQLQTLIDGNEKRRRKRLRDREAKRLQRGSVSREEYEAERQANKAHTLQLLADLMARNPKAKRRELAEFMGLSVDRIAQLKREIKVNSKSV